jgi:Zn ribbon nucleic-acid-binding protein
MTCDNCKKKTKNIQYLLINDLPLFVCVDCKAHYKATTKGVKLVNEFSND